MVRARRGGTGKDFAARLYGSAGVLLEHAFETDLLHLNVADLHRPVAI